MRRFWFVWFFLIFQLYLHKLPYFEMHTDHVKSTLTLLTRVYTMSILLFLFFPHFHSTLQCPPYSCWTPVIAAESSRIQWSPVVWNCIPVNSTGLQTKIEIELESGSKHMYTNSCKHKYSIYTNFPLAESASERLFPWWSQCSAVPLPLFDSSHNSDARPNHFSHPFLGTHEVHQFLDLGHLEGTPFHSGIWAPYQYHHTVECKTHTIPHSYQYHVTYHTIPYHTIPYHLTSYHTVWGPFTKYEKYFYRLQYLSVGLHLCGQVLQIFAVILSYKWRL